MNPLLFTPNESTNGTSSACIFTPQLVSSLVSPLPEVVHTTPEQIDAQETPLSSLSHVCRLSPSCKKLSCDICNFQENIDNDAIDDGYKRCFCDVLIADGNCPFCMHYGCICPDEEEETHCDKCKWQDVFYNSVAAYKRCICESLVAYGVCRKCMHNACFCHNNNHDDLDALESSPPHTPIQMVLPCSKCKWQDCSDVSDVAYHNCFCDLLVAYGNCSECMYYECICVETETETDAHIPSWRKHDEW